jgi:hypothetical protein
VFLERFLDSNNKFEFSTYEVNNTSENRSAIDLNGDVRIEFYDEQEPVRNNMYVGNSLIYGNGIVYGGIPHYGTTFSTTGGVGSTTTTSTYNTSNATFTSSVAMNTLSSKKSIETGRVEKGESSNQNFSNSYEDFKYNTCHEISLKILPLSTKNKTTEDIRQYCTECGTKTKSNFKFCPSCGNKL